MDILADFGCTASPIDLPGHGSSTPETDPSAYATMVEDVFATLPRPTGAVGFSAGAECWCGWPSPTPTGSRESPCSDWGTTSSRPRTPAALAAALEGDAEPEDIQARLFYRMATSSGNDPRSLSAFLRRPREPIRRGAVRRSCLSGAGGPRRAGHDHSRPTGWWRRCRRPRSSPCRAWTTSPRYRTSGPSTPP